MWGLRIEEGGCDEVRTRSDQSKDLLRFGTGKTVLKI